VAVDLLVPAEVRGKKKEGVRPKGSPTKGGGGARPIRVSAGGGIYGGKRDHAFVATRDKNAKTGVGGAQARRKRPGRGYGEGVLAVISDRGKGGASARSQDRVTPGGGARPQDLANGGRRGREWEGSEPKEAPL